ncbi:excalibur calcium-binding domain-containing protein [Rhizobium sp. RAF56]|uniref:excalibur calcium-binding domain-containing protein n=1 Tax=Rhizobium sp. RAF56 TaxID=3233062 RepID=UPI003F9C0140
MKVIGTLIIAAAIGGLAVATPAIAEDYSNIPAGVKGQIKAKCIGRYPDDYLLQSNCVRGELSGYLDMQAMLGAASTTQAPARVYTAPTRAGNGSTATGSVYYRNCSAARAAGAAPIRKGEPGYAPKLDRDGDGIACE